MMYTIYTIQHTGQRGGIALLATLLFSFSAPAAAVHGDDLLRCETTGMAADWSDSERLDELIDGLRNLYRHGLHPDLYSLRELVTIREHLSLWGSLSDCENQLAETTFHRALLDLKFGRIDPQARGITWQSPLMPPPRHQEALSGLLAEAGNSPKQAFELARPENPDYPALLQVYRQALQDYPSWWPLIEAGPTLKEGSEDPRVPHLKQRLRAQGYLDDPPQDDGNPEAYDAAVANAVRSFQRDFNLYPDGRAGRSTLEALNRPPGELIDTLRANLERLRWPFNAPLHRGLVIDIAGAEATLYDEGKAVWSGRVQVGKPGRETPEVRSLITHVTRNPAWNIPTSIFMENKLPRIRRDPDYLEDHNLRVLDHSGNELAPDQVDWASPAGVRLQQQPGPANPLGSVVIRFSNPYAVYLHDTPAGNLFQSTERFYSHGCVRVEGAETLAGLLFSLHDWRTETVATGSYSSGEPRNVHLPRSVPVLMTYRTAYIDKNHRLQFRRDGYQRDHRLITLLDTPEPGR
ncbi:MAG: hypothetical protein HLUCCO03_11190 [Marinobacter sp. HL-58]|nr:MAG: hypothetical protein HLUCCO03_11190 [Marinobacter sp. HL-58]